MVRPKHRIDHHVDRADSTSAPPHGATRHRRRQGLIFRRSRVLAPIANKLWQAVDMGNKDAKKRETKKPKQKKVKPHENIMAAALAKRNS